MNQPQGLRVGVLGAHVIELQVMQPDTLAVGFPLGQRQTDQFFCGLGRLTGICVPQRLLNHAGRRHLLQQHRQGPIALPFLWLQILDTNLDGRKQAGIRIVRELHFDLFQVGAPQQCQGAFPQIARSATEHRAHHGERQGQLLALAHDLLRLWPTLAAAQPGPTCEHLPRLLFAKQFGPIFLCTYGGRNGGIARGEQQTRTRRLGPQRFDSAGRPHIINDDQSGLAAHDGAILIPASQFVVVAAQIVVQGLTHFPQLRNHAKGRFFAGLNPNHPIRESLLHHLIVAQGLG